MFQQNIQNNYVRSLDFKQCKDRYYDMMLYMGEAYKAASSATCLAMNIDFNDDNCFTEDNGICSNVSWNGAVVGDDVVLDNIGVTSVDNGLIHYDKDLISNKLFYELFFNSKYSIGSGETEFKMYPITGNTKQYCYPYEYNADDTGKYFTLNGGFFQGFFKAYDYDYQVLPSYIENDWHFEFVIRPKCSGDTECEICEADKCLNKKKLNDVYSGNTGIFFYIGTRAENKFAEIMNRTSAYTDNYRPLDIESAITFREYYEYDDPDPFDDNDIDFFRIKEKEKPDPFSDDEPYVLDESNYYEYDDPDPTDWNDIDFFENVYEKKVEAYLNDDDMNLNCVQISAPKGYTEIETDNKFLFFNRTCTGFTVHNWDEEKYGAGIMLTGYTKQEYKENAFLLFNRTCTGYTTHNIDEYLSNSWDETDDYNIFKDVIGNAFALKYNEDGSISYKYVMRNCDADEGWSLEEETTKAGLVKCGEWNVINVRFAILDNSYSDCVTKDEDGNMVYKKVVNNVGSRKMKIMIYVNGFLVFVSKELNEFRFRELNDSSDRQEGVPYNISLGGGTQGLGERIWLDYYYPVFRHYYLEENFAGSFVGDIMSFKMYDCMQDFNTIHTNYNNIYNSIYGSGTTPTAVTYGDTIYYGFGSNYSQIYTSGEKIKNRKNAKYDYNLTNSNGDELNFIIIVPKQFVQPKYFTMFGSPYVMNSEEVTIDNAKYIVYTSGAKYNNGVTLNVKGY